MSVRLDHGDDTLNEVHEINVTPFIDVILVLLIIFMVAAPLATVDILVNLPASSAEPQPRPDKPLYLTVKADLTLALDIDAVSRDLLRSTLDAATSGNKEARIFLRADKTVPFGDLMEVMNLLRAAGVWRQENEPAEPAGAIVIEFALVPIAPANEQTEIPPGPEQIMSDLSPDRPSEIVKDKVDEIPEQKVAEERQPEVQPAPNPEVSIQPPTP